MLETVLIILGICSFIIILVSSVIILSEPETITNLVNAYIEAKTRLAEYKASKKRHV